MLEVRKGEVMCGEMVGSVSSVWGGRMQVVAKEVVAVVCSGINGGGIQAYVG